jgi:hypothetical protein
VLVILEPGDQVPEDAVVIQQPHLHDGELSYSIENLEGALPAAG